MPKFRYITILSDIIIISNSMVRLSNATISHITIDRIRRYLEVDYYIYANSK